MKRLFSIFLITVGFLITGNMLAASAKTSVSKKKHHRAMRFTKHAQHHFGSASASRKHITQYGKAQFDAHLHDHKGKVDFANKHVEKHDGSPIKAHIHDHNSNISDTIAHGAHHYKED